jgi:Fic family protein
MQLLSASTPAGVFTQTDNRSNVFERVRGEFREMPGLTLTLAQAGRLWSLDADTCSEVLSHLVAAGFLSRRPDGAFCRATALN